MILIIEPSEPSSTHPRVSADTRSDEEGTDEAVHACLNLIVTYGHNHAAVAAAALEYSKLHADQ